MNNEEFAYFCISFWTMWSESIYNVGLGKGERWEPVSIPFKAHDRLCICVCVCFPLWIPINGQGLESPFLWPRWLIWRVLMLLLLTECVRWIERYFFFKKPTDLICFSYLHFWHGLEGPVYLFGFYFLISSVGWFPAENGSVDRRCRSSFLHTRAWLGRRADGSSLAYGSETPRATVLSDRVLLGWPECRGRLFWLFCYWEMKSPATDVRWMVNQVVFLDHAQLHTVRLPLGASFHLTKCTLAPSPPAPQQNQSEKSAERGNERKMTWHGKREKAELGFLA